MKVCHQEDIGYIEGLLPMSSAAPKKKSFDRGGPVWPPRSNVTNDRLRGGLGGLCPPSQNSGGLGAEPPSKIENLEKYFVRKLLGSPFIKNACSVPQEPKKHLN